MNTVFVHRAGFSATGGGTVTVQTGTNANTIDTTTGTALNVSNTTIGASGLTFRSISANGAPNGIVLNTTGSGGLTVTGDDANTSVGGNSSGGTIQNTTGADDDSPADSPGIGVRLVNTSNVTLRRMTLTTHSNFAIYGENVSNFTFEYATVNGTNGTDSPTGGINNPTNSDASVLFNNLTGAALFKDSLIEGALEDNVRVVNRGASVLNRLVFNNVTIGLMDLGNARGGDGILVNVYGTGTTNVTVQDSDFTRAATCSTSTSPIRSRAI